VIKDYAMLLQIIMSDFREYYHLIMKWLFYRRHALKLSLAIRVADMKQKALNKRITVVLNSKRKFEWWTNTDFKKAKREKRIPKNWGALDLAQVTFYQTPIDRNNRTSKEDRAMYKDKYLKYAERFIK